MSLHSNAHPTAIDEQLRDALALPPSLIEDVIRQVSRRSPSPGQNDRAERAEQLIQMGAETGAALALIELELPQWQVRRLAYDDGEWYCALSRQRELPDWLDQSVDGHDADMALAILNALVEARRLSTDVTQASVPRVPRGANSLDEPLLSDNFG